MLFSRLTFRKRKSIKSAKTFYLFKKSNSVKIKSHLNKPPNKTDQIIYDILVKRYVIFGNDRRLWYDNLYDK